MKHFHTLESFPDSTMPVIKRVSICYFFCFCSWCQKTPPPITERAINTSIITQTLINTVLSNSSGRAPCWELAGIRDAVVSSSCHVCCVVSQQAYRSSLCCLFDQAGRSDVLTHDNLAIDVWMGKPNKRNWETSKKMNVSFSSTISRSVRLSFYRKHYVFYLCHTNLKKLNDKKLISPWVFIK